MSENEEKKNISENESLPETETEQDTVDSGKRSKKDRFALKESPWFGVFVVILFTLGIVLLPGEKLGALILGEKGTDARNLGNAIFRATGFAVLVWLAYDLDFDIFGLRGRGRTALFVLPFVIVAVNNLPIVGLIKSQVHIDAGAGSILIFILNCLFVGLFEEIAFRGIVLPLVLMKMSDNRKGIFWSVIISSALFGAIHLVNLLSGNAGPVFLQVGYSFLVGSMCAMVMLFTRNIFACAALHAGFNFCGLIADEFGAGPTWDAASIALTAIVGVIAALYGVWLMFKKTQPEKIKKLYGNIKTKI